MKLEETLAAIVSQVQAAGHCHKDDECRICRSLKELAKGNETKRFISHLMWGLASGTDPSFVFRMAIAVGIEAGIRLEQNKELERMVHEDATAMKAPECLLPDAPVQMTINGTRLIARITGVEQESTKQMNVRFEILDVLAPPEAVAAFKIAIAESRK